MYKFLSLDFTLWEIAFKLNILPVCKKMFVEILRFEDLNIKYVYIYNTKLEKKQEKNT